MDLGTAQKNLQAGIYKTRQEFFADISLCFTNAETFHRDKPENSWIIKMAKRLEKNMQKERKLAEAKYLGAGSKMEDTGEKSHSHPQKASQQPKQTKKVKASLPKEASGKAAKRKIVLKVKTTASEPLDPKGKGISSLSNISSSSSTAAAAVVLDDKQEENLEPSLWKNTNKTDSVTPPANEKVKSKKNKDSSSRPKIKLKLSSSKRLSLESTTSVDDGVVSKEDGVDLKSSKVSSMEAVPSSLSPSSLSSSKGQGKGSSKAVVKGNRKTISKGKELPTAIAAARAIKKEAKKKQDEKKAEKADEKKSSTAKKGKGKASGVAVSSTPAVGGTNVGKLTVLDSDKGSVSHVSSLSGGKSGAEGKVKAKNEKIQLTLGGPRSIDMGNDGAMTPKVKAQCYKVISALKRREHLEIRWFMKPVDDPMVIDDYRAKITDPMDLGTLTLR
jgi:hypothetical protein